MCAKLGPVASYVAVFVQCMLTKLNMDSEEKGNENSCNLMTK